MESKFLGQSRYEYLPFVMFPEELSDVLDEVNIKKKELHLGIYTDGIRMEFLKLYLTFRINGSHHYDAIRLTHYQIKKLIIELKQRDRDGY